MCREVGRSSRRGSRGAVAVGRLFYAGGSRQTLISPAGNFNDAYDAVGRLTSLTNPYSETSTWTYLDNDWLWTQALPNGVTTAFTYTQRGAPLRLETRNAANTLLSDFASMVYNGVQNRTSVTANVPGWNPAGGLTSYAYDSKDQFTQEQSARNNSYTRNFGYDAAGNPTTFRGAGRAFNSNNQDTAFTWDGNGNPTTYQGTAMTYDVRNCLTAAGSTLTAGYTADA